MNGLNESQAGEYFTAQVQHNRTMRNFIDLVSEGEGESPKTPPTRETAKKALFIDLVDEAPGTLEAASQMLSADDGEEMIVEDQMDNQFQDDDADEQEEEPEEEDDEDEEAEAFNPQVWPPPEPQYGTNNASFQYNADTVARNRKYMEQLKRDRALRDEQGDEPEVQPRFKLNVPDLDEYFNQWPQLEDCSIIAMCRTFANAKAQKMRIASALNAEAAMTKKPKIRK